MNTNMRPSSILILLLFVSFLFILFFNENRFKSQINVPKDRLKTYVFPLAILIAKGVQFASALL